MAICRQRPGWTQYRDAASMNQCAAAWCKQGCLAIILLALGQARCVNIADPGGQPPAAKITYDLTKGHAMAEHLWGIFFEEVELTHLSDRLVVKFLEERIG